MPASGNVAALLRLHDRLTAWGVLAAMAALALIVAAFTLEVVARYGFNTPTRWTAAGRPGSGAAWRKLRPPCRTGMGRGGRG